MPLSSKKQTPAAAFMEPWRPAGRVRRGRGVGEARLQAWWESVVWASLGLRFAAPSLLLWTWAWVRGLALDPRDPGAAPAWWATLALACLYFAWQLFIPLGVFLRALKERLYLRSERILADLVMALVWCGLALLSWWPLATGCGALHAPAASLFVIGGLLGAGFLANLLWGLLGGPRSLRLAEHPPAAEADFRRPAGFKGTLALAHLSDLHLTESPGLMAMSGALGGNLQFEALLRAHSRVLARQQAVVLSGDITDAGRGSEWKVFFSHWDRLGLQGRSVLVPGNHDINIIDPGDRVAVDPAHVLRAKRLVRTLAAMDRLQGDRAWVWGPQGPLLLRRYLADEAPALLAFIQDPTLGTPETPWLRLLGYLLTGTWPQGDRQDRQSLARLESLWQGAFPLFVELRGQDALVVVLDSNVAAAGLWDNALGELNQAQLRRLGLLEAHPDFARRPRLIALHHHVALPAFKLDLLHGVQVDLMSLLNPRDLLAALPSGRQLILHGHRHLAYFGAIGGRIQVVSAPSSTLPDERRPGHELGFYTLRLGLAPGAAALAAPPLFHGYAPWAKTA